MVLKTRADKVGLQTGSRRDAALPFVQTRFPQHQLSRAAQQGDRRRQRLRARIGHSPGRHDQERADVRDHAAAGCRRHAHRARARQAFRPRGVLEAPDRTRLPAGRRRAAQGLQRIQETGRPEEVGARRRPHHARVRRARAGAGTVGAGHPPGGLRHDRSADCDGSPPRSGRQAAHQGDGRHGPGGRCLQGDRLDREDARETPRVRHQCRDRGHRRARGSQCARASRGPAFESSAMARTPTSWSPVPRPTSPPSITCSRATVPPGRSTRRKPPKGRRSTSKPCPTPNPDSSRFSTRRCATAARPRVFPTRSTTSCASRASSTNWAWLSSRAAGRVPIPKDALFFEQARNETWINAKIVAFGATRRAKLKPEDDPSVRALVDAGTEVCAHLRQILRAPGGGSPSHDARREPQDDRARPSPTFARRESASSTMPSISSTVSTRTRSTPSSASTPLSRVGRRRSCCATPTAAICRGKLRALCRPCRSILGRPCVSASICMTTPAAASPTASRRSTLARCTCRARSTATASAAATPTSASSSRTSS